MGFNALNTVCYCHTLQQPCLKLLICYLFMGLMLMSSLIICDGTLFWIFNRRGNFPSLLRLVEYGLNLNATIDGWNVLMHLSAEAEFRQCHQVLDWIHVNLNDNNEKNALSHISNQYHGPQLTEIVRNFIDAGSEIVSTG